MKTNEWSALDQVQQNMVLFVLTAIRVMQDPKYHNLHAVWSGFNKIFRDTFPGNDPVKITHHVASYGLIYVGVARGGAMLSMGPTPFGIPMSPEMRKVVEEYESLLTNFRDHKPKANGGALPKKYASQINKLADNLWKAGFADKAAQLKKAAE